MELKQIKLVNCNLDVFRKMLGISLTLAEKTDTLNITFNEKGLTGISSNRADSLYKQWLIEWSILAESVTGLLEHIEASSANGAKVQPLKCSIYKGEDFSKKILSFFGSVADIVCFHDGKEIKQFQIQKKSTEGKVQLKIDVVTASANLAFVDYSEELVKALFTPESTSLVTKFNLGISDLQTVSSLSKLSVNPDKQTKYITLYTENGQLKATDNCFDVVLHEAAEAPLPEPLEIDKELWSKIDRDEYSVELHAIEENKILVCKSLTKHVTESVALLAKTNDDINFDDFAASTEDFTV